MFDQNRPWRASARAAFGEMGVSLTINDAERRWQAFLDSLSASWNKAASTPGLSAHNGWWGQQEKTRTEDELLIYLEWSGTFGPTGGRRLLSASQALKWSSSRPTPAKRL